MMMNVSQEKDSSGAMGFLKKLLPVKGESKASAAAAPKPAKTFCQTGSAKPCVTVCAPKGSCQCGCKAVRETLLEEIAQRKLRIAVGTARTGCGGKCDSGPFLGFPERGFFYLRVRPENVAEIVEETLVNGRIMASHLSVAPERSYRSDILYEKHTGLLAGIDESACMVEVAKYFLDFEEGLSCGKCVPCRLGLKRMQEAMQRIVAGKGSKEDLAEIKLLCETMITTPHCEFAMTSSRPVLSAITHFQDEFLAHIERRECPAGVCLDLVTERQDRVEGM
jgi:(2Fe-2S) ferredoxin